MITSDDKPVVWHHGRIKTPPFSENARLEAGYLLRRLQQGDKLSLPQSRPMSSIGRRCHELRIDDQQHTWRVIYRMDENAIVVVEVFSKKSAKTPKPIIAACRQRLKTYDDLVRSRGST
jgi:phage-related protein